MVKQVWIPTPAGLLVMRQTEFIWSSVRFSPPWIMVQSVGFSIWDHELMHCYRGFSLFLSGLRSDSFLLKYGSVDQFLGLRPSGLQSDSVRLNNMGRSVSRFHVLRLWSNPPLCMPYLLYHCMITYCMPSHLYLA